MCTIFDFSLRGCKDSMVVDPNCRDLPVVWQFWRQIRIMEWEHSCLLVSDSRNLAGACSTSSFLFKGMVLSHETSTQNTQDSWRVWKILAIFASDLILAVKLKIRRSQQSRLLPPLRWGRFLMNGKAALQACWWDGGGGGGCCTGWSSVTRLCSCGHAPYP